MRGSSLMVTGLCAAISSAAAGQQPPDTFRSSRELLTINASIRDANGRPVMDLQPADFSVRIDGEARRVLVARVFGREGSAAAAEAPPVAGARTNVGAPPGRIVVIAVDRDSIRAGAERALLETAARMLDTLTPADAAGAIGLPGAVTDLTRDRAVVAEAIRRMTGTQPITGWRHRFSWEEAMGFERGDSGTIKTVQDRECPRSPPAHEDLVIACHQELPIDTADMLRIGRAHASVMISNLSTLIENLRVVSAPKHVVLISAGLPFDMDLLPKYQALARAAAQSHVSLSVVQLDQQASDAADGQPVPQIFGGRQDTEGLANIASITGGQFFAGVGRATGAFDRIAADINYFYELGVESKPSDADGKPHRVEVKVGRDRLTVRAPAETAAWRPASDAEAFKNALAEPTDVAELPLEVTTYMSHSRDPEKVRVIVAAAIPGDAPIVPREWRAVVISQGGAIAAVGNVIAPSTAAPWSSTGTMELVPGRYRLRTVIIDANGRKGILEVPLAVGMRAAGNVQTSDVILGAVVAGRLEPRSRLAQGAPALGMIELSSAAPLEDTGGFLQVVRAGAGGEAAARPRLRLRAHPDDNTIVIAEAPLDLSSLAPGSYTASVVLERSGTAFARVSRMFDVVPGSPSVSSSATAAPARAAGAPSRAAGLDDVLQRIGRYVADYGQQASLLVGLEHYEQRLLGTTGVEVSRRVMTAEFALVKTADAIGWSGFRDVIDVDGRHLGDHRNRLQTLFRSSTPNAAEARRIADESARFNLGPVRRNINDPMAALFFLTPALQSRFAFEQKGESSINGMAVLELEFKEKTRPTLIRTSTGRDVPCSGTIWVNPADGTVVRTVLSVAGVTGNSGSKVDVTYARDNRLELWLPATMQERHETDIAEVGRSAFGATTGALRSSVLLATATYSDFKRFETSATFKVK